MNTIFLLLTIVPVLHAALAQDSSFQQFCEFWNGGPDSYKPRDAYNSLKGDTCTITFPTATEDENSARTYCEAEVPYHINEAIPGDITTCKAEATLICDSLSIQMFGKCYEMTYQLMTRDEAKKHCEKENPKSTIAFMHREALPFRIHAYYTDVSRIWIDASEAITSDLIYNVPGGNLLLALEGYEYNLPNVALARVAPTERAMVLCEYTPRMTQAESSNLLKRYGEIYHPTVFTSDGAYVRTASSLNRNENENDADNKYCAKVLAPFIPGGKAQSAVPTREFLNEVKKANSHDDGLIIRTSAFSKNSAKSKRTQSTCFDEKSSGFQIFLFGSGNQSMARTIDSSSWRKGEPQGICDAASWSSGIVLSRDGEPGLEVMSDARYAPLYCQSITESFAYGPCPSGFKSYDRKSLGQKWCHKLVEEKMFYDDAEANCVRMGAHVSGFSDKEEWDFLLGMYGDRVSSRSYASEEAWLGAKRKEDCIEKGTAQTVGYVTDSTSPCSRERVFQWQHDVALNPPKTTDLWHNGEPNYKGDDEKCLTILRRPKTAALLNDLSCKSSLISFCGMEAPIVQVS